MRLSRARRPVTVGGGSHFALSRDNRMMNRRTFTQSVAASAGAIGLTSVPTALGSGPTTAPTEPDTGVATTAPVAATAQQGPQVACVADFQELARLKLPRATYEYITAGST